MKPPCRPGMTSRTSSTSDSAKAVFENPEVQRSRLGHVLGFPGGEPQAPEHAALPSPGSGISENLLCSLGAFSSGG
jgi:hypothetical protein